MAEEAKVRRQDYVGGIESPTFYANQVNALATPFDLRLRFSQIEDANDERVLYKEVVTVYLSPAEAKALHRLLTAKAADYDAMWSKGLAEYGAPPTDDSEAKKAR